MFGLSVWEIFALLVVTLLVVGPERMPGLARSAGEWVVKIRRFVANAKAEMDSEFNTKELKQLLNSQEQELENLRKLMEDTKRDVEDSGRHMLKSIDDAKSEATQAGADLSDELNEALESGRVKPEKPAESAKPDTSEATVDKTATENSASPARRDADEDDYDALLKQADDTFSRPFAPPDPIEPASEVTSREQQAAKADEPKERRD